MTTVPEDLEPLLSKDFPPQRGFSYPRDRWRSWLGHLEGVGEVLTDLPEELDRKVTAELVQDLLGANTAAAFTAAMIWGHGHSGYGPYRTAWILTGVQQPRGVHASGAVIHKLDESVSIAREQGMVEGFRFLNTPPGKIAGLGPAFFTKWLFFATARGDVSSSDAAPVLDKLVMDWLRSKAGVSLRRAQTSSYSYYVALLNEWGAPYQLSPASVEERIFRLMRGDGQAEVSLPAG